MHKAGVLLTRLTRQFHHHWVSVFGAERVQRFIDFFQTREIVKARTASANFPDSLWPTKHQHTHHRHLGWREMEDFRRDMLKLWNAAGAAVENVSEILFAQAIERLFNLIFSEGGNRTTVVLLIARQRQPVECQRIIFRRRDLLFDQRAKDADFYFVQYSRHITLYSFSPSPLC